MNLCFTYESRGTLKSFTLFITVKTITKVNLKKTEPELNTEISDKSGIKISKISCRGLRSPDNAEFDHFTLLFAEDGKEMYNNL